MLGLFKDVSCVDGHAFRLRACRFHGPAHGRGPFPAPGAGPDHVRGEMWRVRCCLGFEPVHWGMKRGCARGLGFHHTVAAAVDLGRYCTLPVVGVLQERLNNQTGLEWKLRLLWRRTHRGHRSYQVAEQRRTRGHRARRAAGKRSTHWRVSIRVPRSGRYLC